MAASLNSIAASLVLLFGFSLFFIIEARPLSTAAKPRSSSTREAIEDIFEGFYIEEIKTGGPAMEKTNMDSNIIAQTLVEKKKSGPSPGGNGHGFTGARTLGNMKNSGPSPGGNGHAYTDAVKEIEQSGPSPGEGN